MQIEYNEAVTFNTFRTLAKKGMSEVLVKEIVDGILGLLFNNIHFAFVTKRTALDIIESWLPCSCLVNLDETENILTITNTIYDCKYKYLIDFEKNQFSYLPSDTEYMIEENA